jgi:hypothetical protein
MLSNKNGKTNKKRGLNVCRKRNKNKLQNNTNEFV